MLCDRIGIIDSGRIAAQGSMEDLRSLVHRGEAHLEDIFLAVTGGEKVAELVASLREPSGT